MFVSFLAQEPKINPNYEKVKYESEAWIAQQCQYDEKNYKKHVRADFPYFVSIFAREAGPNELRTICDLINWIFDFDDLFDEGCFRDNKEQAATLVAELIEVMKTEGPVDGEEKGDPLLEVFKTVWYRIVKRSSGGARRRFVEAITDYAEGVISQVNMADGHVQNLIALYGYSGLTPQDAYDKIDVLLKARYRELYLAQADLPQWGEAIDRQVQKYIQAVQDVITANLYW
ncbi:MAG: hypothetical protein Q9188_005352, partial [Gyalolechia gomerana]